MKNLSRNFLIKILIVMALSFLMGCASVTYQTKDGEKFIYSRFGAQSIQGLDIQRNEQGVKRVIVKSNKADIGELANVIRDLAEMAAKETSTP